MSDKIVKENKDLEGWILDEILRLKIRINHYSLLKNSSSFFELPMKISETKAVMNVINKKDSHCFKRKICIQTCKLDSHWHFTTPASLSLDVMLLHTKITIELFTDYDMLLFIENGVKGGISQCSNRYAIANNKYMPDFNYDDEMQYLIYLDANDLYGYAMSKYLPLEDFA
ncbi:uncharacterized protein NPIL_668471 [Nephila pilipes]|uniref:DNA-directed DNA polymerase n=1 Tax=Nephila pilipes TaxID=299642 RepID=A0A8X6NVB5_NEPPI|nr:uncharacterized protein NPIL_668471 [Nephila pilipes]